MSVPFLFYLEQAESCAKAAADAQLPNQRDTYLRSEKAWQTLADRTAATAAARAAREAQTTAMLASSALIKELADGS